jgi:TonB family protein
MNDIPPGTAPSQAPAPPAGRHWIAFTAVGCLLALVLVGAGAIVLFATRAVERTAREELAMEPASSVEAVSERSIAATAEPAAVQEGSAAALQAGLDEELAASLEEPASGSDDPAAPAPGPTARTRRPTDAAGPSPVPAERTARQTDAGSSASGRRTSSKVSPKGGAGTAVDATEPGGPADGEPVRVGGDVTAPERVSGPQPVYTREAREARIQGVVIVEAVVDREGRVGSVRVLKSLPMGLDEAAVEAVRQWRFRPATRSGEPVPVYYVLTVNFRLE